MHFSSNYLSIILALAAVMLLIAAGIFLFSKTSEFEYSYPAHIKILFAGDLMFDLGIRYYAEKGGGNDFIFEKILNLLFNNDLAVVNLEGPITGEKSVSSGTAPGSTNNYFFTFDPSVAKTLSEKNIKLVNLGNNHILNFGSRGLESTKKYLDESSVDYFGAPNGPKKSNLNRQIRQHALRFGH